MNLNFKMSELIHSDTANKFKINNIPNINSLDNMLNLIVFCLQPVRELLNKPIAITSGYRCEELNYKITGKKNGTSHHKIGSCADFVVSGLTPKDIVEKIKNSKIPYRQLIEEYSNGKTWVHIEYLKNDNKRETLLYQNGKYKNI